MATRYVGDATVKIEYVGYRVGGNEYRGTVSAPSRSGGRRVTWKFSELYAPAGGFPFAYDSPEAYDRMAASAVAFASYYTTHNRSDDTPDWAPRAEVADAIDEAVMGASDAEGQGLYEVRRSKRGKGRYVS